MQRTALILEPRGSGHHSAYLRWIVDACREARFLVTLGTTSEALEYSAFKKLISDYKEINVLVSANLNYEGNGFSDLVRRELHYQAMFKELYGKAMVSDQPNVVILPYVDYCSYALALLGVPFNGTPWFGIAMRPTFHFRTAGVHAPRGLLDTVKKTLFHRLMKSKGLLTMLVIDPTLDEVLRNKGGIFAKRVRYLPDPAEETGCGSLREARLNLGITDDRIVLLIAGAISQRKGIRQLFAMLGDDKVPKQLDVIIGGMQDKYAAKLLEHFLNQKPKWRSRIHVLNRFLTPDEMRCLFTASDIVWSIYEEHYVMSGIIISAGRAGLPVVATDEGIIGWLTAKGTTGLVVDHRSPEDIIETLSRLVVDVDYRVKLGENGKRAFSKHTIGNAKSIVGSILINETIR